MLDTNLVLSYYDFRFTPKAMTKTIDMGKKKTATPYPNDLKIFLIHLFLS